jgi:3-oxoacyl-[acyl-carrier protein] reductase
MTFLERSTFANFADINVDDEKSLTRVVTRELIANFAELTGDDNPLHLDDSFGARTQFGGAVAHGMLSASFISTIIGTMLPGAGALWMSQTLEFVNPVRPGDTVTLTSKVVNKHEVHRTIDLYTVAVNQYGTRVIEGRSKVKLLEEKKLMNTSDVSGGTALVTGGSRGIGAACAKALAASGFRVAVNYSASEEQALAVVKEIESAGGQAIALQANVTDPHEVNRMFETIGPVTVLVNNAWPKLVPKPTLESDWAELDSQLSGVRAAFLCSKAAVQSMLAAKYGRIITIGSIAADNVPPVNQTAYVTAKGALASMMKSFAVEFGPKGITCNVVSPGLTETTFISEVPQKAKLIIEAQSPMRRIGQVEDVSGVVAFLASPAARMITGENLRVCGGLVMQ